MENSTTTGQEDKEPMSRHVNEETKSKSTSLAEYEAIENTPFTAVRIDNKGWFLALGNNRLTEPMETKEEVKEHLKRELWNVLLATILIIVNSEKNKPV